MQRKLGVNCDCIHNFDPLQALTIIKDLGYDCFFTGEHITELATVSALKNKAEKLGLSYEFIHAPFKNVNSMWLESEQTKPFMEHIFQAIDNAAAACVPQIILHTSSTWTPPAMNEAGFARYDELVAYAEKKKVCVAFENLRIFDYYATLLHRYKDNAFVRFCFDNGHEHWCMPERDHIHTFAHQLSCTHLHDNFGKPDPPTVNGDLHLLPFDGNYDFANMIKRLDDVGYQGALTLEIFNTKRADYLEMRAEAFLTTAYERLKKISEYSK